MMRRLSTRHTANASHGFTLVEVLVSLAILGIVSGALVAILATITRTTADASIDTRQSQQAISIFERVAFEWSNGGAWGAGTVDGQTVENLVPAEMGADCSAVTSTTDWTDPSGAVIPIRKRIVITCVRGGDLQPLILRAEFGNPGA